MEHLINSVAFGLCFGTCFGIAFGIVRLRYRLAAVLDTQQKQIDELKRGLKELKRK